MILTEKFEYEFVLSVKTLRNRQINHGTHYVVHLVWCCTPYNKWEVFPTVSGRDMDRIGNHPGYRHPGSRSPC